MQYLLRFPLLSALVALCLAGLNGTASDNTSVETATPAPTSTELTLSQPDTNPPPAQPAAAATTPQEAPDPAPQACTVVSVPCY